MARRADDRRPGVLNAAGRLAFYPARVVARASRGRIEAAAEEAVAGPELARIVDQALAGPLPEHIAHSIVRHRVVERIVAELAASGELNRLVAAGLASPRATELADEIVTSEPARHAVLQVVSSVDVRTAIARQTTGFAEELAGDARRETRRLDDTVERAAGHRRTAPTTYGGVASRGLALALDSFLVLLIYASISAMATLIASLVGSLRPAWIVETVLAVGWVLVAGGYFVFCWRLTGRTVGMHLMHLHVHDARGRPPGVLRSVLRFVALGVSIAIVFLGFVPALYTERRRALPDLVAGTTVGYD
ncbi:MAG TPA: RDD family protein [Gaiellaceae bacterium]|nr:RDD family protein [Gaiellaceae bacterium]